MKRTFVFFMLIFVSVMFVGCNENPSKSIDFSEIEYLALKMPDETEHKLKDTDTEQIIEILSAASTASQDDDLDGGLSFNAYVDEAVKYTFNIYSSNYISIAADGESYMYQISPDDYKVIEDIAESYK